MLKSRKKQLIIERGGRDKNQELGITLIALVIAIIVILILAGVSIMMLTGDNRITKSIEKCKR